MDTFAFIGHGLSIKHLFRLLGWPDFFTRFIPQRTIKRLIRILPPYQLLKIPLLESITGKRVQGYAIVVPFLPEHLLTWGEQAVLRKIITAGQLAEHLGAKVVGLAGFASIVGNEGEELAGHLNIAVTSGNTLTASLVLQGLRKSAKLMGIPLNRATVAVVGATGDIGSVCSRILAREVKQIHIAARHEERLENFAKQIQQENHCSIHIMKHTRDAVRGADLVLTATSATTTLIEPQDLKSGAIVCDVAIPHNVGTEILQQRQDVFVFEGGLARLPMHNLDTPPQWKHIAPDGVTIFGCLAETVVLAFEGRFENYSMGRGNITPERLEEIQGLATHHGICLADFRYRSHIFSDEQIRHIRTVKKESREEDMEEAAVVESAQWRT